MQQALAMKQLTVAVGAVGRAFASASEGAASTIKYNPAKGPKAAYVPADARTASENARDLFRRLRQAPKSSSTSNKTNSSFAHSTKESTTVLGGNRDLHNAPSENSA
ncbi:hypothetical protein ACKKBF_B38385 [Auxenochlorella protothecoides x Auxenochlorella symbiontica]